MFKYRNDHDTSRLIADLDLVVEPGEVFESAVELQNPLLVPVEPSGLAFSEDTLRWEKPKKAKAAESAAPEAAQPT